MTPVAATLISAVVAVAVNLLTAAFLYGQLTATVKSSSKRISNLEQVVSGQGGHGERITALEAARLHVRSHHGD